MSEERLRVLQLLKDGKITVDDAAKLLEAVDDTAVPAAEKGKNIRIVVKEHGKNSVNVTVPLGLAKLALKAVPRHVLEDHSVDLDEVVHQIQAGYQGKIVEVKEADNGNTVEIFVE